MPNRFPLSTAPVVTPAGISTPPAGAFSSLSDALAADGFDALGRWIADFTAGLADTERCAPVAAPDCRASSSMRRSGTDAAPCVEAPKPGKGTSAGEESHSPASPCVLVVDLRHVAPERRDEARDQCHRDGTLYTEPCLLCDADMERTTCPGCGGKGKFWVPAIMTFPHGGRFVSCDRCWGHGWLMRCASCGAWDDDPQFLAAERRALGEEGRGDA